MEIHILSKFRLCRRQSDLERCASDFNPTYWISATVAEKVPATFAAVLGVLVQIRDETQFGWSPQFD
jgi:hypothetical protein